MKGDFRQMIPLPRKFIQKYEKDLSSIALLKDPNGKVWHVGLKRSAGRVFLQNGWPEFVEHHSLCNRHLLVLKYKGNSMFEVLIFDNSASTKKHEKSSSSNGQDPNYESESSVEILGVCTPHKAHVTKQATKRTGGGRIPLLRSHGPPVMPNVMGTESMCNKRRNRNELLNGPEMRSSKRMGNVLEPSQSTHLKSAQRMGNVLEPGHSIHLKAAQPDRVPAPMLPQEVESNNHKRKAGNEDPFLRSVNPSTASKGSFPLGACNGILMDAIENKNQQLIRRSTQLKSAQSDLQHVQKLPQEVESNHHKQKDGNEDPSFQSVNLSTASKGSFPHEVHNGILTDEIENENQQPIRRSTRLKSAQLDISHAPELPQEVKSDQSKQNDGDEGPSLQSMNLSTDSRGCFPCDVRNDFLTDEIENEYQQPIRKKDSLGELRRSIRLSLIQAGGREVRGLGDVIESNLVEQNTAREDFSFYPKDPPVEAKDPSVRGEIRSGVSWNKAAIECIQPSNEMDNVRAPQCSERIKSFQSNGKKHEESNYDSNYELENSVEILGVCTTEGEGDNLGPTKRKGGRIPFLRSHGPAPKSFVMEIESKYNKPKNRSEDLFIDSEMLSSKQRGDVLEPRRSTRLNSAQSNITHVPNLPLQVKSNHHKQKDGDGYLSSVNLNATAKGYSPSEVRDGILTDEIKNEKQQPIRKQCSLGVQQWSIRLRSFQFGGREVRGLGDVIESKHVQQNTAREEFSLYHKDPLVESGVQNGISCNKAVTEGLQLSEERNNVTAPRRSERIKSFQSDGKCLYGSVHESGPDCKTIHNKSEQTPLCSSSEEFSTTVENQRTESVGNADEHISPSKNVEHLQEQGQCVDMPPEKWMYYRFISKRRPVTTEERQRAKEEAQKFNSDNPFFIVVMPSTYVYCRYFMYIPHKFAKDYILREVQSITLAVLDGRRWPVRCLHNRSGAGLGKGWATFVWENNLEEGDVCVFELVNKEKFELRVLISRVVEEVVPFIRASEIKQDTKATSS